MDTFHNITEETSQQSESYLPDWIDAHCAEAHLRNFLQVEQQCGLSRDFENCFSDCFHLEIFHVMLQGDFKAVVGRIEVVWNGHWVKHSYSWRPSNLQGEVSLCHGLFFFQYNSYFIFDIFQTSVPDICRKIVLHSL